MQYMGQLSYGAGVGLFQSDIEIVRQIEKKCGARNEILSKWDISDHQIF
jgi:hypothetical protein